MATLTLNIYGRGEEKNTVVKKYTAEGYDLRLGTIAAICDIMNASSKTDEMQIAISAAKGFGEIMPLLKDIFDGVTDEDLQNVKVKELLPLFVQIGKASVNSFEVLKRGN